MVEEAPAAILGDTLRLQLHRAAIDLLVPIRYRNAGTVEFLYDVERQAFYFMEVNARIQVEHPVSEEITGVDLVQLQLLTAYGAPPPQQADLTPSGHAIEVRIIAEDPDRNFLPSPGRISRWRPPEGPGIRLDTAMYEGATVPPFYDSMIAKLIVKGADRAEAVDRLRAALEIFKIEGIATNLPLLAAIAAHEDFRTNRIDTRWLERTLLPAYARHKGN
jgi:acetyl-CoA carboxylase biotin carboxylase subunit